MIEAIRVKRPIVSMNRIIIQINRGMAKLKEFRGSKNGIGSKYNCLYLKILITSKSKLSEKHILKKLNPVEDIFLL